MATSARERCPWAVTELSIAYHDREWGVPTRDDRALFELLILEGAQAGLSWETILRKREGYRRAFDGFDWNRIARYDQKKLDALMLDDGIIRNRLKIASAVTNARATIRVIEERGSLSALLWDLAGGEPKVNRCARREDVPARTPVSDAMSKELKRRGFKFVGSTICYAFMQATGMVNDHFVTCPRHAACAKLAAKDRA